MSGTWHDATSSGDTADSDAAQDAAAERRVMLAALDSFARYRRTAHYNVTHRRRQNFYALPQAHQTLLRGPPFQVLEKLDRVDDAIDTNGLIAQNIVEHSFDAFGIERSEETEKEWEDTAKSSDLEKARSTVRQFFRDWSAEGAEERAQCFGPVLRDLEEMFPDDQEGSRDRVRVLIPGAGLGRLVVEICALGFEIEGNEISFHQLMASNWILNGTTAGKTFDLHPWAYSFSNQISKESQLRSVKIPDVHPGTYLHRASEERPRHAFERMSMSAADFCTLYAESDQKGTFDAVTAVYFIDTAPNLIRYIEAISNVLRPGGYWINLGPLLWHFEDRAPGEVSKSTKNGETAASSSSDSKGIHEAGGVELTVEETLQLVRHFGFEVVKQEMREQLQGYIQDTESLIRTSYKVLHFVARKQVQRP